MYSTAGGFQCTCACACCARSGPKYYHEYSHPSVFIHLRMRWISRPHKHTRTFSDGLVMPFRCIQMCFFIRLRIFTNAMIPTCRICRPYHKPPPTTTLTWRSETLAQITSSECEHTDLTNATWHITFMSFVLPRSIKK